MEYLPGFNIDSEKILEFGIYLIQAVVLLTCAIFLHVVIKRALLVYRNKRRKLFLALWRPILIESVAEVPGSFPKLDKKFVFDFIGEWNALYEKLGGISRENLIQVASALKINEHATKMLQSSHIKIQLIGIITLGNMRVNSAWNYLESIALSSDTLLSLTAYRALAQIDQDKAIIELLPKLIKRLDWPASMVAKILKEAKSPKICELLADACMTAKEEELPNIIKYINVLNCSNSTLVFRHILNKKVDDHIISLCLHELHDPSVIDIVRRYVEYPRWHVRVNTAHALGNIGTKEDVVYLKKLLNDKQWWVRYRAAQALVKLPFLNDDTIRNIQKEFENPKAQQILEQALAERDLL